MEPDSDRAAALAYAFCRQARLRIDRPFDALWRNTDSADEAWTQTLLAGERSWYEADILDPPEGTDSWIAPSGGEPDPNLARRFLRPTNRDDPASSAIAERIAEYQCRNQVEVGRHEQSHHPPPTVATSPVRPQ